MQYLILKNIIFKPKIIKNSDNKNGCLTNPYIPVILIKFSYFFVPNANIRINKPKNIIINPNCPRRLATEINFIPEKSLK